MELQPEQIYPKVGIAIMVMKEGKILLGQRKGSHGSGVYAFPGGSLEYMERIEDCIHREIAEEVGIVVDNIRFVRLYNLMEYAPKHFLDLVFKADWVSGEPLIMEPDKCDGWDWYDPEHLPTPLFETIPNAMMADRLGIKYINS